MSLILKRKDGQPCENVLTPIRSDVACYIVSNFKDDQTRFKQYSAFILEGINPRDHFAMSIRQNHLRKVKSQLDTGNFTFVYYFRR